MFLGWWLCLMGGGGMSGGCGGMVSCTMGVILGVERLESLLLMGW